MILLKWTGRTTILILFYIKENLNPKKWLHITLSRVLLDIKHVYRLYVTQKSKYLELAPGHKPHRGEVN
jgi:hypothetical protein